MRGENHIFPKNGSGIFFATGLDRANQFDFVRENNRFAARAPRLVMPGLGPGIHVFAAAKTERRGWPSQARP
jgi:hypothetical protein